MQPLLATIMTLFLIYRAWSRQSLTSAGLIAAAATAVVHAVHPWSVFSALLAGFFQAGTTVTKINHDKKTTYTALSSGGSASVTHSSPRAAAQVFCNSLPASLLILLHAFLVSGAISPPCLSSNVSSVTAALPYGVFAHYASAAADTFSSELGILSDTPPVLVTDIAGWLKFSPRRVPRGTNGGITLYGVLMGSLGAATMGVLAVVGTPFCEGWSLSGRMGLFIAMTVVGTLGSLLDSVLGALLQASVVDARSGKVVEAEGGGKVLYDRLVKDKSTGRAVLVGTDVLSNNGVNLLMCSMMSLSGVVAALIVL